MPAPVIILNGGSSSGTSTIARCLQDRLGPTWLTLGVDDLLRALPGGDRPAEDQPSISYAADGTVSVDANFRRAEDAWYLGLAAIGRAGVGLIVDEVFLGGARSQERLAGALAGVPVRWIGVRCDPAVAAARERQRGDRVVGMAEGQSEQVHAGVHYDLVVDTSHRSADECAATIAAFVRDPN